MPAKWRLLLLLLLLLSQCRQEWNRSRVNEAIMPTNLLPTYVDTSHITVIIRFELGRNLWWWFMILNEWWFGKFCREWYEVDIWDTKNNKRKERNIQIYKISDAFTSLHAPKCELCVLDACACDKFHVHTHTHTLTWIYFCVSNEKIESKKKTKKNIRKWHIEYNVAGMCAFDSIQCYKIKTELTRVCATAYEASNPYPQTQQRNE